MDSYGLEHHSKEDVSESSSSRHGSQEAGEGVSNLAGSLLFPSINHFQDHSFPLVNDF